MCQVLYNDCSTSHSALYEAGTIIIPILQEIVEVNFSKSSGLQEKVILTWTQHLLLLYSTGPGTI